LTKGVEHLAQEDKIKILTSELENDRKKYNDKVSELNLLVSTERAKLNDKDRSIEELKRRLIEKDKMVVDIQLLKDTDIKYRIEEKEKEWSKDRDWYEKTVIRLREEQEKLIKLAKEKKERRKLKKELWTKEISEERMKKDDRIEFLLKTTNEDKKI